MDRRDSPDTPRATSHATTWDAEADAVVVGYGGAGACAAIEAAGYGADLLTFGLAADGGRSTQLSSPEMYLDGKTEESQDAQ